MEIKKVVIVFKIEYIHKILDNNANISLHHPHNKLPQVTCNQLLTIQFQKISDARRTESGAKKFSALAELTDDISSRKYSLRIRSAPMIQFTLISIILIIKYHVTTHRF